jgi:hypothetical protein
VVAEVTDRNQRLELSSGYVHLSAACHIFDGMHIFSVIVNLYEIQGWPGSYKPTGSRRG